MGRGQELALGVVEAFLVERAADALHHAAADLLVHQHRVDHAPAVLNHPETKDLHKAGFGIDLDVGRHGAVGEDEGEIGPRG